MHSRVRTIARPLARSYNFASSQYLEAFGTKPPVDIAKLRADTVAALASFDAAAWTSDPMRTVVAGVPSSDAAATATTTTDAFDAENGAQLLSSAAEIDAVIEHLTTFRLPEGGRDLRVPIRAIEATLLTDHAATLIANQAVDFKKQDGVTEIEESIEANVIERTFNDQLWEDEVAGRVTIGRAPAFVGCVSNFSNFLDLCRKTLRNLELGVPCVVLSRSNTTQHMYRWFQLLDQLLADHNVDRGLLTFISADITQQRRVMAALGEPSPLYLTGSRPVAAAIKELLPRTFSSTGGPNTMVATELSPEVVAAAQMSVTIENSGQCTAMRHMVVPNVATLGEVDSIFDGAESEMIASPSESLQSGGFANLYTTWGTSFEAEDTYATHSGGAPVAYKLESATAPGGGDGAGFPYGVEENWRRAYLDVTSPASEAELRDPAYLASLAKWLVTEQPITLAINGDSAENGYPMALQLFEQTSQVVYSVGAPGNPALTCQARPQDGEIFGEFPPRRNMTTYTKAPTIVPSSTPSCNSTYDEAYLIEVDSFSELETRNAGLAPLLALAGNSEGGAAAHARGYIALLASYLRDACGPKTGYGERTAVWGLQRPPLNGQPTVIRVDAETPHDALAVALTPFWMTNARDQLIVSCDTDSQEALHDMLASSLGSGGVEVLLENNAQFEKTSADAWNVITPRAADVTEFGMVGQQVSLAFPLGHIKSTLSDDAAFTKAFSASPKWLAVREELK